MCLELQSCLPRAPSQRFPFHLCRRALCRSWGHSSDCLPSGPAEVFVLLIVSVAPGRRRACRQLGGSGRQHPLGYCLTRGSSSTGPWQLCCPVSSAGPGVGRSWSFPLDLEGMGDTLN